MKTEVIIAILTALTALIPVLSKGILKPTYELIIELNKIKYDKAVSTKKKNVPKKPKSPNPKH